MKVLLVQAYLGEHEQPVFPLGLASIVPTLGDHIVKVFDTNTSQEPFTELEKLTIDFCPDVIGISLRNIDSTNKSNVIFYYKWLKDLITAVRAGCSAKIIIGGSGFSMFAQEIMEREPYIDLGVYLEGETVFYDLLQNLNTPHKVHSIYYRQGGKVHFTGNASPVDINQTFVPSWNVLDITPYKKECNAIGIETKRGCALRCIYCVYGFLNGRQYRLKRPKRVVDEIEMLVKKHGVTRFTFVDSIFNVPLSHAQAICNEMVARKLTVSWSAWFNEQFLDQEFVTLLMRAGCNHLIFSPDGFSDAVLKKLGKNTSQQDIVNTVKLLKTRENAAIEVSYNFFKNPPGQSLANFFGMLFFCLRAKFSLKKRCHFEFSVLRIEPHTELYRIALDEGVIDEKQSLLKPTYYTNQSTRYLEIPFNYLLSLWGK